MKTLAEVPIYTKNAQTPELLFQQLCANVKAGVKRTYFNGCRAEFFLYDDPRYTFEHSMNLGLRAIFFHDPKTRDMIVKFFEQEDIICTIVYEEQASKIIQGKLIETDFCTITLD